MIYYAALRERIYAIIFIHYYVFAVLPFFAAIRFFVIYERYILFTLRFYIFPPHLRLCHKIEDSTFRFTLRFCAAIAVFDASFCASALFLRSDICAFSRYFAKDFRRCSFYGAVWYMLMIRAAKRGYFLSRAWDGDEARMPIYEEWYIRDIYTYWRLFRAACCYKIWDKIHIYASFFLLTIWYYDIFTTPRAIFCRCYDKDIYIFIRFDIIFLFCDIHDARALLPFYIIFFVGGDAAFIKI